MKNSSPSVTPPGVLRAPTTFQAKATTRTETRRVGVARQDLVLFGVFLVLYVAAAYYVTMVLKVYYGDTVARTALGYFVVYGRDPHLAAVGFVWTPLLSFVQILLFPLLRLFDANVFAGPLVAACFGAATLPVLNLIGRDQQVRAWIRLPVVILYGLQPILVLYNAIGMSEIVFFFFMSIAMLYLLRWAQGQSTTLSLVMVGLAIALCFWVRYEAIPLVGATAVSVLLVLYTRTPDSPRKLWTSAQGALITVMSPAIYSILLWILFNWMIVGDPFFWWSGQYSNVAFTEKLDPLSNPYYHNMVGSVMFALTRVQTQIVVYPLLIAYAAGIMFKRRTLLPLVPWFIPAALILFQVYESYSGASWGWYRFFTYSIISAVIIFFWLHHFLPKKGVATWAFEGLMIVGLVVSMGTSVYAVSTTDMGKEEQPFLTAIASQGQATQPENRSFADAKSVAEYLRMQAIDGPILIDTFQGFPVVLFADRPDIFIKTQDLNFQSVLHDPVGHGVKWVLVPRKDETIAINDWILNTYPDIWEKGTPWATLYKDFGSWRLYRVNAP